MQSPSIFSTTELSHSNHKWLLLIPKSLVNKLKDSLHGGRMEIDFFFPRTMEHHQNSGIQEV